MKKEIAEIVDALVEQGFEIRRARSGRLIVLKQGVFVWTLPSTRSGELWKVRTLTKLCRAGLKWPVQSERSKGR